MYILNQAKGRVIREGSHNRLDEDNRDVRIYIHIAALKEYKTIEKKMWKRDWSFYAFGMTEVFIYIVIG